MLVDVNVVNLGKHTGHLVKPTPEKPRKRLFSVSKKNRVPTKETGLRSKVTQGTRRATIPWMGLSTENRPKPNTQHGKRLRIQKIHNHQGSRVVKKNLPKTAHRRHRPTPTIVALPGIPIAPGTGSRPTLATQTDMSKSQASGSQPQATARGKSGTEGLVPASKKGQPAALWKDPSPVAKVSVKKSLPVSGPRIQTSSRSQNPSVSQPVPMVAMTPPKSGTVRNEPARQSSTAASDPVQQVLPAKVRGWVVQPRAVSAQGAAKVSQWKITPPGRVRAFTLTLSQGTGKSVKAQLQVGKSEAAWVVPAVQGWPLTHAVHLPGGQNAFELSVLINNGSADNMTGAGGYGFQGRQPDPPFGHGPESSGAWVPRSSDGAGRAHKAASGIDYRA